MVHTRHTASFTLVILVALAATSGFGDTRQVDDDGVECPGAFSADIQSALDASIAGDVVEVCNGLYLENVVVHDGLTLQSLNGKDVTFIEGIDTAAVGAAVVTVGSDTIVAGFDISCPTCTNGTLAGVGNSGAAANIVVSDNRIHDLRDTTMDIAVGGFDMSGIRLFEVEDVVVSDNMIHDIDNILDPSTFTSRARGIFVSGGDEGSYRGKPEGAFVIVDNTIENIFGFRPIGINVHRMDQDVEFADLVMDGNCVSSLTDTGLQQLSVPLGSVAFEIDEVEELDDGIDVCDNHAHLVNIAFAIRNSTFVHVSKNLVSTLNPIGSTLNLVLDSSDIVGNGHDNVFCRNWLDAAGGLLVGPEAFDNKFPFGRTFTSEPLPPLPLPITVPDSPGLGGDGLVEAENIQCNSNDFVCPTDKQGHKCRKPSHGKPRVPKWCKDDWRGPGNHYGHNNNHSNHRGGNNRRR